MTKVFCFIALIFVTTTAISDCGDDPNNMYQTANCDFDTDFSMWSIFNGTASTSTDDFQGSGTSGSVSILSSEIVIGMLHTAGLNQCFDVASMVTDVRSAGVWFKNEGSSQFDCTSQVQLYQGTTCSLALQGDCTTTTQSFTNVGGWNRVSCDTGTLAGEVQSVRLNLSCSNGPLSSGGSPGLGQFTMKADNVYVLPQGGLPVDLMEFSIE